MDLEMIPQLMAAFVQSLKKGERFKVKIQFSSKGLQ